MTPEDEAVIREVTADATMLGRGVLIAFDEHGRLTDCIPSTYIDAGTAIVTRTPYAFWGPRE